LNLDGTGAQEAKGVRRQGVRRRWRRRIGAAGAAGLVASLCLALAPTAQAALGLQDLSAQPANLAAGANSDVNIHIGFSDPADQVKDLTVHLPPGLVGNPTATPLCTVTQLNGDSCPANTQVGSVTAHVNVIVAGPLSVPLTVDGTLYNLTPHQGEPARFGIVLRPLGGLIGSTKIIQQSAVQLRRSDFGLDTIVNDFPRTASGLETDITSLDLSLMGTANGHGFIRNPTSCTPKTVTFDAVSYGGHTAHGSAPSFSPTNCDALPFSPTLTVTVGAPGATKPGSPVPLTTVIQQDATEAGLAHAKVLLPNSIGANAALLTNSCKLIQFQVDASGCPAKTIVGSASATSPFVPSALTGPVVLVAPKPNDFLPRLGVELNGPLSLHILGNFVIESTGPGNEFAKLPDIPIARFALRFHGGKDALASTSQNLCTAPAPIFLSSFDGFNGAHQEGPVTAQVKGCG
jgi:hypothetical protein